MVPAFDVVRVEPSGDSVIAGRASPGAAIELLRNGQFHFQGRADAAGFFALLAPTLPPGSHELVIDSISPHGKRTRSRQSVTVAIANDRTTPPLVALTSPDAPTQVFSNPDDVGVMARPSPEVALAGTSQREVSASAGVPPPRAPARISVIDAEEGRLSVSGHAAPGATLRLYLNDVLVAPGVVGADGTLAFTINRGVKSGTYRIRLDEIDPVSGLVRSRAEVPYSMPAAVATEIERPPGGSSRGAQLSGTSSAATVLVPEINTAIVSRGDNLWKISHRIYGAGLRYTAIYGANQHQIRNPNLIFPGQSFVVPPQQEPEGRHTSGQRPLQRPQ